MSDDYNDLDDDFDPPTREEIAEAWGHPVSPDSAPAREASEDAREAWCRENYPVIDYRYVAGQCRVLVRTAGGKHYAERDTRAEAIDAARGVAAPPDDLPDDENETSTELYALGNEIDHRQYGPHWQANRDLVNNAAVEIERLLARVASLEHEIAEARKERDAARTAGEWVFDNFQHVTAELAALRASSHTAGEP